ncbi:cytochrome P450 [Sphaerisporangium rubeum]|uniref:Pentalenic acid synthase n=1 Tax=Sphaerisporangium rubeum TaxID=321317 RepID=A0A7X0M9T7_9ACTN|nr:cytochrome P450 [Sphaerisporangium rubeum]MBB6475384.1 pentalenic acid synthase [Sphaerisporangium rubeum]
MNGVAATTRLPGFPMDRQCPYHPPPGYTDLRAEGPAARVRLYDGRVAWVVTGHADTRRLLLDRRLSSDRSRADFPVLVPRMAASKLVALVGMDPPEHDVQRRMLAPSFTVNRVKTLRPAITRIVTERIDALLAGGPVADLVPRFALPVPSTVICELLGVPYDDHEFFEDQTRRMLMATSTAEQAATASGTLVAYFEKLIAKRIDDPGEGLVGTLIRERLSTGELDRTQIASIVMFLLVAGHETTANMIGLSILTLLEHPEELNELRQDPHLIKEAVEELLRFLSVADELQRVAAEDIELGDVVIKAGDGVYLPNASANRDAEVFPDPDVLDLRRDARPHLAFGHGVHQCIGQNLARAELEIGLQQLITRIPTLRLAEPVETLGVKPGGSVQGIYRLPVTW